MGEEHRILYYTLDNNNCEGTELYTLNIIILIRKEVFMIVSIIEVMMIQAYYFYYSDLL